MRGDALAQLNVLTSMSNVQENSPRAGQHIYIDVPLRIEPLAIHWVFFGGDRQSVAKPTDATATSIAP
jgi:hypothetical protein